MGRIRLFSILIFCTPILLLGQDGEQYLRTQYQVSGGLNFGDASAYTISLEPEFDFKESELSQIDLLAGVSTGLGSFQLAASLVYRLLPGRNQGHEWRPWQQLSHAKRFGKYRLRNRFRMEERFCKRGEATNYDRKLRLRYRVSTDFPLQGERLDIYEFYLNASVEWVLGNLAKGHTGIFQWRTYVGLGYQFSQEIACEIGLDFRRKPDLSENESIGRVTIKQKI
ncbi:MAG: DUF2490 domain-containing protein [Saprospiraceae bacterium]|nr:DUF2490 domain-containing protein [Saprospiraceae bacterium]